MEIWIARDKGTNELWGYTHRPLLDDCGEFKTDFPFDDRIGLELPANWFPEVTFENSPKKVELKLVKDESKWDILRSRVECLMEYEGNEEALVAYQAVYKHIKDLELTYPETEQ